MDLLGTHNLDYMDSGFVFEGNSSPKTSIRTVLTKNTTQEQNQQPQQQQQQRNLIKTTYNNNNSTRNRTLSSTYHFVSTPVITENKTSLYSMINHDDAFDDDQYLNLESYRRSRNHANEEHCSSLPSTNSIETVDRNIDDDKSNELDKVKSKLTSMWNNVKYGWTTYSKKVRTNFDKTHPICILGRFYSNDDHHLSYNSTEVKQKTSINYDKDDYCFIDDNERQQQFKRFDDDISSRLWFTYRKEFAPINGTKYTSDAGWGCMLRSVQMLLGQGFLIHFLGRNWSLLNEHLPRSEKMHREIISWFNDRFSNRCPFGLHRLLSIANDKIGKNVGDWFGPGSVIILVRDALESAREYIPLLNNLHIYVAQDCTIYKQDVLDMCLNNRENSIVFNPVIILVSVRLGGEDLNEIYIPTLKLFLERENCLGIIGGKPKHSLYFIGYQGKASSSFFFVKQQILLFTSFADDKVIYLDPHVAQNYIDMSKANLSLDFDIRSFHCHIPGKTSFAKLDPSLAIGFYCKSIDEFEQFCNFINNVSSVFCSHRFDYFNLIFTLDIDGQ